MEHVLQAYTQVFFDQDRIKYAQDLISYDSENKSRTGNLRYLVKEVPPLRKLQSAPQMNYSISNSITSKKSHASK